MVAATAAASAFTSVITPKSMAGSVGTFKSHCLSKTIARSVSSRVPTTRMAPLSGSSISSRLDRVPPGRV